MALTKEMSDQLKDYFPVQAHEFVQGATYLSEEAIADRLDEVDPSWEFHRLGEFAYRDNFIIATFRMTVSGVSRDGIGMWDLKMKKKDGVIIDAVDPEKSVSTDALKRAARLFGIGRYILEMRGVSDQRTLTDWLAKRQNVNTKTGEIKLVENAEPPPVAEKTATERVMGNGHGDERRLGKTPEKGAVVSNNGNWDYDLPSLMSNADIVKTYPQYEHRANAIKKLHTEGYFEETTFENAVATVIKRPDKQENVS